MAIIQIREVALSDIEVVANLSTQRGYPATAAEVEARLLAIFASRTVFAGDPSKVKQPQSVWSRRWRVTVD